MNNILIFIKQIFSFLLILFFMIQMTTAVGIFPQILTETHNQTSNLFTTAILTCRVRDLNGYHVTWFKKDSLTSNTSPLAVGEQLFTTDKRYSISFYSTSKRNSSWSLEIYQLNPDDEGTYLCKIANRRVSVSISIHLHIHIPMTISPTNVSAEPGACIKLNCSILMINNNRSLLTWHFSSKQLNNTKVQNVTIRRESLDNRLTSYLTIKHAQIYHTGVWTCVYKDQRLKSTVIIQKDVLKNQRTSALLSNNSHRQYYSINFFLFLFYFLCLRINDGIL